MAGATLVFDPDDFAVLFAQRYFIEGMDLTGGFKRMMNRSIGKKPMIIS